MPMALRGLATPLGVRKLLLHCSQTLFGDETRAIETFEYFSRRAVALCPPRWTITRSRVVAYVDIIEHEERAGVAPDHSLSATTAVRSEHRSRAATVTLISTRGWNVGRRVLHCSPGQRVLVPTPTPALGGTERVACPRRAWGSVFLCQEGYPMICDAVSLFQAQHP